MLSPQATKRITYINYGIFVVFALFYALLSMGKHYLFWTHFWDLGVHTHTLKQYAEGALARFPGNPNIYALGDHFSINHILYSPLYHIFGSYTLLVIQWIFMLIGAVGIWQYIKKCAPNSYVYSPFVLLFFFSNWGLCMAMNYDFHPNVPGAMMIPWLILFYRQRRKLWFWVVLVFIVFCQENSALFMFMLMLSLSVERLWKERARYLPISWKKWKIIYFDFKGLEFPALVFCALYFYVLLAFIMPSLHSAQFNMAYPHLGSSAREAIRNLIFEPSRLLIPYEQLNEHQIYTLKLGIIIAVFGGAYLVFLRPWYIIALVGFTAWRYMSNNQNYWSQIYQYSAELAPFFAIVLVDILRDIKISKWTFLPSMLFRHFRYITFFFLIIVLVCNMNSTLGKHQFIYHGVGFMLFQLSDQAKTKNRASLYEAISKIPDSVEVLTHEPITPHLLRRPSGALLAISGDDNNLETRFAFSPPAYVLLSLSRPFTDTLSYHKTDMNVKKIRAICQHDTSAYETLMQQNDVYLFKRKDDEARNP